jgi:hypothetical protein
MDYQITHTIPDGADPDGRIDAIYGPSCGLIYEDQAISQIDWGINTFYTLEWGMRANVYAITNVYGTRFLTTSPDGFGPNNLCRLPRYV